ncbi:MAG: nucleoside-triphosphatase [Bacteroidota bacterium]
MKHILETLTHKPLNSIWLKAAVVGSLWASIEIIIGSFLHNLRIPFTGAILSFIGVYLLVSSAQIWKERGLILRAGVICALMKSISPSAMILGPMIGILTEAIILELIIFIFGKNLVSYMLGGAFAVFSTIVHKVVSLIIMYGFDFITILDALYRFGVKQVNLSQLSPLYVVIIIAVLYLAAGMVAALLGYRSGLRYLRHSPDFTTETDFTLQHSDQFFPQNKDQRYSVLFLVINLFAVVGSLLLINSDFTAVALIFSIGYIGFCIIRYKRAMRRFKNSLLWIQFFILILATSLLWTGMSSDTFFSTDGLFTGLKMIFRAIIVITGYAAISVELRNPLIKSIMYKKGFSSLYQSLGLAFSALPGIIAILPNSKEIFKQSSLSFSLLFRKAEIILKLFEKEELNRPSIIIITGEIREGKTTFTKQIVDSLKEKGLRISGFLALGIDENGKRTGFNLLDITTAPTVEPISSHSHLPADEPESRRTNIKDMRLQPAKSAEIQLCSNISHENRIKTGHYYFNPDGLKKGKEILSENNINDIQLFVIDEVGPLEINNQGWASSIETLCKVSIIPQLWVVRKSLVKTAVRKWNTGNIWIFDIKQDSIDLVIKKIQEIIPEKAAGVSQ